MTEHDLLRSLLKDLRKAEPRAIVFKHADYASAAVPDFSVTFNGRTTWWEAKHARPNIVGPDLQRQTLVRMAVNGYARYVVWQTVGKETTTFVVHPYDVTRAGNFLHSKKWPGVDNPSLVAFILSCHAEG